MFPDDPPDILALFHRLINHIYGGLSAPKYYNVLVNRGVELGSRDFSEVLVVANRAFERFLTD